ncbi:uncharacterized protein LOC142166357 [Nicotiana tabacum]|uniref:Uncharacterized protein LOC142166357 n=1 Tax=Nicotiana tabacum TaxID=4097 RepID=A0AC58S975_TOBAC
MPLSKNKSCKKIGGKEETRRSKKIGETGGNSHDHHVQIHLEESMKICFYTNVVFYFAGEATVSMPYSLRNFQLVVLVQCTHSTGRELKVGKSMEARKIWRAVGEHSDIEASKYRRFMVHIIYPIVLVHILINMSLHWRLQTSDTQEWNTKRRLPRNLGSTVLNSMYVCTKTLHFIGTSVHKWCHAVIAPDFCWKSISLLSKKDMIIYVQDCSNRVGMERQTNADHHDQILWEEIMGVIVYTNFVFFFAGKVTVSMSYSMIQTQWVVLTPSDHSFESVSVVSASMDSRNGTYYRMGILQKDSDNLTVN